MNKDIFIKLLIDNQVLKSLIFKYVHHIHKFHLKKKDRSIFKWNQIVDNPIILAQYNYLDLLKQYFNRDENKSSLVITDQLRVLLNEWDSFSYLSDFRYTGSRDFRKYSEHLQVIHYSIKHAIKEGHLNMLKYLFGDVLGEEHFKYYFTINFESSQLFSIAGSSTAASSLEILEYLYSLCKKDKSFDKLEGNILSGLFASAGSGRLDVVQSLQNKCSFDFSKMRAYLFENMCKQAAKCRSLDILKWLISKFEGPTNQLDSSFWVSAIEGGSIELMEYMISNHAKEVENLFTSKSIFINTAIWKSSKEVVEWLFSKNAKYTMAGVMLAATKRDRIEFIEWLYTFFKSTKKILYENQFESALHWYHHYMSTNNSDSQDSDDQLSDSEDESEYQRLNVMDKVMYMNAIEIVQWLHRNSNIIGDGCTSGGIYQTFYCKDNRDMLAWVHHNRTERCTDNVTENFRKISLENQRFIINHYSELLPEFLLEECGYGDGNDDLFDYIVMKYPEHIQLSSLRRAAEFGNLNIIKSIYNKLFLTKGCDVFDDNQLDNYQNALQTAATYGQLETIKFLCENAKFPDGLDWTDIDTNPMSAATEVGRIDIINYLHNNTIWKLTPESYIKLNSNNNLSYDEIKSLELADLSN